MRWTCGECGKRVEFSAEQLGETRGVVVCPQCLSSEQIPGYDTPKPQDKQRISAPPSPPQKRKPVNTATNKPTATPPPHRKKPTATTPQTSQASATPRQKQVNTVKRKTTKKKSGRSRAGCLTPMSTFGCLWRTVVFTLILLTVYIIFGMLLQGL